MQICIGGFTQLPNTQYFTIYATSLSRLCGTGCCGGWNVGGMRRIGAACGKRMVLAVSRNAGRGQRFGPFLLASSLKTGHSRQLGQKLRRRRRAIGQGLISQGGPCPREPRGGPKCGQGPRHRIRPCPLKRCGGVVGDSGLSRRRGECSWSVIGRGDREQKWLFLFLVCKILADQEH